MSTSSANLKRLGKIVQARRLEQGWDTREEFSESLSFSYRVVTDLENGNRKLGKSSYREVETVLGWTVGSIDDVLSGGDPTPTSRLRHATPISHAPSPADVIAEASASAKSMGYFDALRELQSVIESTCDAFQVEALRGDVSDEDANSTEERLTMMQGTAIDLLIEHMARIVEARRRRNERVHGAGSADSAPDLDPTAGAGGFMQTMPGSGKSAAHLALFVKLVDGEVDGVDHIPLQSTVESQAETELRGFLEHQGYDVRGGVGGGDSGRPDFEFAAVGPNSTLFIDIKPADENIDDVVAEFERYANEFARQADHELAARMSSEQTKGERLRDESDRRGEESQVDQGDEG